MFIKNVSALARYWHTYTHRNLTEIDLSSSEHAVIMHLAHQDCVNQDAIAENLALDKGTIARALTKLEQKNLVSRVVNEHNRRENLVSLTPYGQSEVNAIIQVAQTWNSLVMQGVDEWEQKLFVSILTKITHNAKQLAHTAAQRNEDEN